MNCIFLINSPRMRNKLVVFKQIAVLPPHLSIVLNFPVERVIKTSKVAVVRAKAKMQNILSKKSLEKTKQIQPCC